MDEQQFIASAFNAGLNPQQVSQALNVWRSNQPKPKTIGGFAGNVVKSAGRNLGGAVAGVANVFNPNLEKNTLANVARLTAGGAQLLDPTEGNQIVQQIPGLNLVQGNQEQVPRALGSFYNQRYGISDFLSGNTGSGAQKVFNTVYDDPVGVALDASTLLGGAGAVAKGVGAGELGANLSRASRAIDPIQAVGSQFGRRVGSAVKNAGPGLESAGENLVTRGLGNPAKQAQLESKYGRSVGSFIDEYNLYDRSAESAGDVLSEIGEKFDDIAMRSGGQVNTTDILSAFDEKIAQLQNQPGGVLSNSAISELDELTSRRNMFVQAVSENGQLPPTVGLDKVTQFRRNVIDPDVPQSMFNLDARGSGSAKGVKGARDIIKGQTVKVRPELQKVGSDYGMAKGVKKLFESSAARGKNRKVINFSRLGMAGLGTMAGGLPGTVAGFVSEGILNSPAFAKSTSKILKSAGKATSSPKIPQNIQNISDFLQSGYSLGKTASRINPNLGDGVSSKQIPPPEAKQISEEVAYPNIISREVLPVKKTSGKAVKNYKKPKNPFATKSKIPKLKLGGL